MDGFYLLALGIALLLLSLPYAEITYANRLDRLGLFGIIGGLLILWGIVPRPDAFEPPGPLLARARASGGSSASSRTSPSARSRPCRRRSTSSPTSTRS